MADENVRHYLGRSRLNIGLISPIGRILPRAELAHEQGLAVLLWPQRQLTPSQKIPIVFEKLLQARARHIDKFNLPFFRGTGYLASFNNILLFRSCRLNHLVDCSVAFLEESLTEPDGALENDQRLLISEHADITTMWRNKTFTRIAKYMSHRSHASHLSQAAERSLIGNPPRHPIPIKSL